LLTSGAISMPLWMLEPLLWPGTIYLTLPGCEAVQYYNNVYWFHSALFYLPVISSVSLYIACQMAWLLKKRNMIQGTCAMSLIYVYLFTRKGW
jgi:hypothetical protein